MNFKKSEQSNFLSIVKRTLLNNKMVNSGDKVLVAVSGGADSIALLYSLIFLANDLNISLGIIHMNHMMRNLESNWESMFVKFVASKFSIPFYTKMVNVLKVSKILKLSIEETGRKLRYAFFRKTMIKYSYSKIALAHHMDDDAESTLMFLLRGAGSNGISGISFVRNDFLIRPFINVSKLQIFGFLLENKIKNIEDRSNKEFKFTRNKVRNKLIPFLSRFFNPRINATLNKTASIIGGESKLVDKVAMFEYRRSLILICKKRMVLSVPILYGLNSAIQRKIIRKIFLTLLKSAKNIGFTHIEKVLKLFKNSKGNKRIFLPNTMEVVKTYNQIEFAFINRHEKKNFSEKEKFYLNNKIFNRFAFPLTLQNDYYSFTFSVVKQADLCFQGKFWGKNIVFFDLEALSYPINIRLVKAGDRFNPLGTRGYQKISRYFINKKIPFVERVNSIVIQANYEIIWLVMHEICNCARLKNMTKDVLMIKFCLLKI